MISVKKKDLERTRERLAAAATRAAQQERAEKLARGEVTIPPRCGFCRSSSIERGAEKHHEAHQVICAACGRRTPIEMVHRLRRQEIRAFIEHGVA